MITLFFIIQSELSEGQRERLVSSLSLRNIQLPQYTCEIVKTQYYDLFITTRTNLQDPNIRPSGGSRSKTFFILDQGDYEGEEGLWVEDEEGAEGFCPLDDEEAFWQLEDHDAFVLKRFQRRTFKSGKGRKGRNGKGKRRRGSFRPFRNPQSSSAEPYQDDWGQSAWWSTEWNSSSFYTTQDGHMTYLAHITDEVDASRSTVTQNGLTYDIIPRATPKGSSSSGQQTNGAHNQTGRTSNPCHS